MTLERFINYKCLANSSGFLLPNSCNLSELISLIYIQHVAVPSFRMACLSPAFSVSLCYSSDSAILPCILCVLPSCIGIDLLPCYWPVSSFLKPMKETMHVRLSEWFFLVPKPRATSVSAIAQQQHLFLTFCIFQSPPQFLNSLLNRSSHRLYKLSAVSNSLPGPFSPNKWHIVEGVLQPDLLIDPDLSCNKAKQSN